MLHSDTARRPDTSTVLLAGDPPVVRWGVRSEAIRRLEIDASQWRSQKDFYDALSDLLGGVERHCRSSGAILETMIYYPYLNTEQPPYEIVITNCSARLRPFLCDFARGVAEARQDRWANPKWGDDIEVVFTVA
jgi:hypothetical protein